LWSSELFSSTSNDPSRHIDALLDRGALVVVT